MTNTKSSTHTQLVTVRGPGDVFVPPTRTVACAQTVQQRGKVVRRVCVRPRRSWRVPTLLPLRLLVTCTADRRGCGRWPSSFLPCLPFFLYLLLHLLLPQQQQQQQRLHPLRLRSALSAESPIISTARRAHGGGHAIHMRAPVAWHTHTHADSARPVAARLVDTQRQWHQHAVASRCCATTSCRRTQSETPPTHRDQLQVYMWCRDTVARGDISFHISGIFEGIILEVTLLLFWLMSFLYNGDPDSMQRDLSELHQVT